MMEVCKQASAAVIGRPSFVLEGLSSTIQDLGFIVKAKVKCLSDQTANDINNLGISFCFIISNDYDDASIGGFLQKLIDKDSQISIVILSDEVDLQSRKWPLARGWLPSSLSPDALIAAFEILISSRCKIAVYNRTTQATEQAPSSALAQAVAAKQDKALPLSPLRERLSQREQDVFDRLRRGESNKHIARRLGISDATVKIHVRAVLRKTGAENRTQAALFALNRPSAFTPVH